MIVCYSDGSQVNNKACLSLHTSEMTFSREHSTMWTERVTDRSGIMADCERQKKDVEEFWHDHHPVFVKSRRKCEVL